MEEVELVIKHKARKAHSLPWIEENDETVENDGNEMKLSSISTYYSTSQANVIPSARTRNDAEVNALVVVDQDRLSNKNDSMQFDDSQDHLSLSMLSLVDNIPNQWLHSWYNELLLNISASDKVKSHHLRKRQFLELLNDRECVQCTFTCNICHNSSHSNHDEHIIDSTDIIHDGDSCRNMLQFITLHRHINLTLSIIWRKAKDVMSIDMFITDCFHIESCMYLPHLKRSFSHFIQDSLPDQPIAIVDVQQSNHSFEQCRDLTGAACNKTSNFVCPSIISFIHDVVWLLMEDHMEKPSQNF